MVTIGYSLEAANKVAVKALSEELAKNHRNWLKNWINLLSEF